MIVDLVDKLVDRVIQLVTYKKQMRAALLEEAVTPAFSGFERVHSAYLESFSRYRELIRTESDPHWASSLQAVLQKDNLFSADSRAKVVRLAETGQAETRTDDRFDSFVRSISEYLMGTRLLDPIGRSVHPLHTQRWRQSLFRTLGEISDENWQLVLDPNGARPPMTAEEMDDALSEVKDDYLAETRPFAGAEGVKRACALHALDAVVGDMQAQYDQVCRAYLELKTSLSN
jgi:hypothetical protein